MEPTWQTDGIKLFLGDARDVLPTLGKVDAVITDPPFGVLDEEWDDMTERELARFTMQWLSVVAGMSGTATLFFGERTRSVVVPLLHMLYPRVRQLIWNKQGGAVAEDGFFYAYESIYVCKSVRDTWEVCEPKTLRVAEIIRNAREAKGLSRGGVDMVVRGKKTGLCYRWEEAACLPTPEQAAAIKVLLGLNGELDEALDIAYAARNEVLANAAAETTRLAARLVDVLTYPTPSPRVHPCEKPVALLADIISAVTTPGQLVADPFMGSGPAGAACVQLGRPYIGIESDPEHFATAVARIETELSRNVLFEPAPVIVQRSLLEDSA